MKVLDGEQICIYCHALHIIEIGGRGSGGLLSNRPRNQSQFSEHHVSSLEVIF